jgi:group I intron endonuclease
MVNGTIYKHTCVENNKAYIGYTTRSIDDRWREHINMVNRGSKFHFHNAIRKYGLNSFIHEILINREFENIKEIQDIETKYIEIYDTYNNGYNSTKGGEGCIGLLVSDETKEKLRKAGLKENLSKEKLLKMRNAKIGKKLSEKTRMKLSRSKKGVLFTEQHKKALSESKTNYYSNTDNRIESAKYHCKEYNLVNENLNINLCINNLKQYCIDNDLNYKKIHKTIKRQHCTRDGWIAILC